MPILVAVNKIDKPGANPDIIRNKLSEHGLVSEEWGGETIYVNVSAKTKEGIDKLLEMLALQAEVLELKANPNRAAKGHVVEARLDRARGPISTILVEEGTLRVGELVVAGEFSGKIRAMLGDQGQTLAEAGPSTPVEVLGLDGVPDAGETFNVVEDERAAKSLVEHRRDNRRKKDLAGTTRVSLENILDKIKAGDVKEVKIVLKADVQGSIEAIANALTNLTTGAVGVNVISTGVGGITESDVSLAKASSAIIIGFNVRPAGKSQQMAEQEGVDIKLYQVIYDAIDDVKKAMVGMLAPVLREKVLGRAEVRQVFTIPKAGTIAGSFVIDGKVTRKAQVRLIRDSVVVFTGKIGSLRRFKDDASEVAQGYECGIGIEGLRRRQGRRRHRSLRDRVGRADAGKPDRSRQPALIGDRDRRDRAAGPVHRGQPLAQGEADGPAAGQGSGAAEVQRVDRGSGRERRLAARGAGHRRGRQRPPLRRGRARRGDRLRARQGRRDRRGARAADVQRRRGAGRRRLPSLAGVGQGDVAADRANCR